MPRSHPTPSTRVVAARVLQDIERRHGWSNRVLSEHLERRPNMSARDRGLVTHLVYGVLRHRTRLDAHIDAHARKPAGIKGELRQVLRIAALELLELSHPPHAAIAEAAKAAASLHGGAALRGVVHAIVTKIAEHGPALDTSLDAADAKIALVTRWSIPAWIAEAWIAELGEERARRRAAAVAVPPPLDLRVDLHRTDRATVLDRLRIDHPRGRFDAPDDEPQAIRVHGGGDIFFGPLYAEGLIAVQGLGAQQPARWLDPQPGMRVLDACAGMGIKTQQLAEIMQRHGTIVAADADARRLAHVDELRDRAALHGELDLACVAADLTQSIPAIDDAPFDAVLLDAPCTGLGNLARHPEIRWWRQGSDVAARVELQVALLQRCLGRVRPGGRLVYAVCSFDPREGPGVTHRVTSEHAAAIEREATFTPEDDGTEGFYVARIVG